MVAQQHENSARTATQRSYLGNVCRPQHPCSRPVQQLQPRRCSGLWKRLLHPSPQAQRGRRPPTLVVRILGQGPQTEAGAQRSPGPPGQGTPWGLWSLTCEDRRDPQSQILLPSSFLSPSCHSILPIYIPPFHLPTSLLPLLSPSSLSSLISPLSSALSSHPHPFFFPILLPFLPHVLHLLPPSSSPFTSIVLPPAPEESRVGWA